MAKRPIIEGPSKSMPSGLSGLSRPGERDVLNYSPPQGPRNILDRKGPGIHGDNEGPGGEQGDSAEGRESHQSSGSPGLGGKIRSVQGRH
jgi:hypothetical protein